MVRGPENDGWGRFEVGRRLATRRLVQVAVGSLEGDDVPEPGGVVRVWFEVRDGALQFAL
ncbi:hypothetical protein ACFQL0_22460 [Haloplanus litoreus]|uniref:hypothetical protein n=1 Tax=Haloplanus litoreus TaxID=767515 RepID=UPI0036150010